MTRTLLALTLALLLTGPLAAQEWPPAALDSPDTLAPPAVLDSIALPETRELSLPQPVVEPPPLLLEPSSTYPPSLQAAEPQAMPREPSSSSSSSPTGAATAPVPLSYGPTPGPAAAPDPVPNGILPWTATYPHLQHPGSTLVHYGREVPRLRCAPLRACVVELQEGETVFATISGDTERWAIERAVAGPRGRTPLLAIKPTGCELATNLIVSTDRRIYLLDLTAPACPRNDPESPGQDFTPLLRFSYPRLVDWQASASTLAAASSAAGLSLPAPVPVEQLNFRYTWSRRGRFPWTPEAVFDDGTHTYIRLPAHARQHPAPVLLLVGERGATEILNYSYRPGPGSGYYVTDRVIDRAALVLGAGRGQRRLTLVNEARLREGR